MRVAAALAALLLGACGGCATPAKCPADALSGRAWPEADALFHQDPRWLGADGAYSVPLGGDRTLWLFGDTFVANTAGADRHGSTMVRNSVALQTGLDPSTAKATFHWRSTGGKPSSFLPEKGDDWFWPQHGRRLGKALLLFFSEVRRTGGDAFGFEAVGGAAFVIDDADAPPDSWSPRQVEAPTHPFGAILGGAVVERDGFLNAFSVVEPGIHDALLARWPLADATALHLGAPEWRVDGGWAASPSNPSRAWSSGAPEISVFERCGELAAVESVGFGATTLGVRTAPAVEGPWSDPTEVFRPAESDRKNVLVYAGKAHPELQGADIVATYASNTTDFAALLDDTSLYFPRFVRLDPAPH